MGFQRPNPGCWTVTTLYIPIAPRHPCPCWVGLGYQACSQCHWHQKDWQKLSSFYKATNQQRTAPIFCPPWISTSRRLPGDLFVTDSSRSLFQHRYPDLPLLCWLSTVARSSSLGANDLRDGLYQVANYYIRIRTLHFGVANGVLDSRSVRLGCKAVKPWIISSENIWNSQDWSDTYCIWTWFYCRRLIRYMPAC